MATATGFPDATNTGVLAGTTLKSSGPLVITTPGAVIQGLDISGGVVIKAPNVTLLNCKVSSSGYYAVQIDKGVQGVTVQNCTIDSQGGGGVGISGQGNFIANNIYGAADGINVWGDNTVIQDNYIHGMAGSSGSHFDSIQADGAFKNLTIEHNTVINEQGQTSAIMLDNYWGAIDNVKINNNLLVGGGYTVYINESAQGTAGTPGAVTNVSFTNNHIGPGTYGPLDLRTQLGHTPVMSNNVNDGATIAKGLVTTGQNTGGSSPSTPTTPTQPTTPDVPKIDAFSNDSGVVGDGITNDNTVTLTGKAAANSTVKVFDGTTQIGTATANSSGAWSYTTAALKDGSHSLTAKATNASGATSAASSALNLKIDTTAPTAPTMATAASTAAKTAAATATATTANTVTLTGTAEANSTIKVFDGSTQIGTATTNSSGAWTYTTGALASGNHSLTSKAMDAAGNTGAASTAVTVNIPSTPTSPTGPTTPTNPGTPSTGAPKIASFSNDTGIKGDGITSDNTLTLTGTAAANSKVAVFDGGTQIGTATANSSGAWSYTTTALADGAHNLTAKVGTSASSALSVKVDTHAPDAPKIASFTSDGKAVSGGAVNADHVTLTGTAEANSVVKVFDGTKQIGTATANDKGAWTYAADNLADGQHSFTSTASDAAGNLSKASAAVGLNVDTHTGGNTADSAFSGLYQKWNDTVSFKGTADPYSQITIYDNGKGSVGTVKAASDGTWSLTTKSAVSDTVHNFTTKVVDSSGQTSTGSGSAILGTHGADTLKSTSGNDVLTGNGGRDTFVFAPNFGKDVITDFQEAGRSHDVVQFSKSVFDNFADVLAHASQSGQDVLINAGGGHTLTLKDTKLASLDKYDFHFA